jgi:hypothetical protein
MNISEALESKLAALRLSLTAQADGYEDRDHRRRFGKYERRTLKHAEPYFWSRQITDAVLASSKTLPRDTRLSLAGYQQLQSGWFWFERLVDCGGVEPFAGLLWCVADVQDAEDNNRPKRSLVVTTYHAGPRGLPQACDTAYLEDMVSLDRLFANDRRHDNPEVVAIHKEQTVGDEVRRPGELAGLFAFLLTSLLWIDQTIVVAKDATADRAVRRRLAREGLEHDPAVRVVTLRRQSREGAASGDGEHVEWSCQWIVRGHWRQQFYPGTGERRPLFILPYVKGPEDKPLKAPAATVFAVTR